MISSGVGYPNIERERLAAECHLHAPPHLQRHVSKALALLDVEVQSGRRTYAQVLCTNVLTVAGKLFQHELNISQVSAAQVPQPLAGVKRARSPERPEAAVHSYRGLLTKQATCAVADFIGKNSELERDYSRDEPTPEDIRPLSVLRVAFAHVQRRSQQLGEQYLSDQLKGMRQDIRVQNLRNPFALEVYEAHARLCLTLGNLSEFNQCQSAVLGFYREGLVGEGGDSFNEFLCYRLLYLCLGEKEDLIATELKDLARSSAGTHAVRWSEALRCPCVLRVLRFCACVQQGDSFRAVQIALDFDSGQKRLLSIFVQRQRVRWLREVSSSIKGFVPARFILNAIGFTRQMRIAGASAPSDDSGAYLDGSLEGACQQWSELTKLLKLPPDFCGGIVGAVEGVVAGPSFNAGILSQLVGEYCSFLSTRTDIAPE